MVLLNGRIEVTVVEARGLPNLDNSIFNSNDKSDPYCVVSAEGINGSRRIGKTFTIDDNLNPKWNFKMVADLNQDVKGLMFVVKDEDIVNSEVIGTCFLDSLAFTSGGKKYRGLMNIASPKGRPAGFLTVQVNFTGSGGSTGGQSDFTEKMRVKAEDIRTRMSYSNRVLSDSNNPNSVFFHGMLDIYIEKAVNLPDLDKSVLSLKSKDVSDPYVDVVVEDSKNSKSYSKWKVATTSVIDNDLNPVWKERFFVNICHDVVTIKFIIKDKDVLSSDVIGTVTFRAEDLQKSKEIKGDFELYIKDKPRKNSKLTLSLFFKSTHELSLSPEVTGCLYPLRDFNNVTLYQDAHCVGLPIPILDKYDRNYNHPRAWLDLYNTLIGAQSFIYIVGWSVNTEISLLRWNNEDNRTLGSILLQKAKQGVDVCIMVWNELTSTNFNKEGAMGTSDQATAEFFKGTEVTVILAARERHSKDISTKEAFTNLCYSHHQKCVLADSVIPDTLGKRQIVAYVGGLDITNGRFDTPEHPLFETLNTDHRDDFYNTLCISKSKWGPREPWHDIHCRIEGPVATDLLGNFKERWRKQGSKKNRSKILIEDDSMKNAVKNPERWGVQMFRSINSDSAEFNMALSSVGLTAKKERLFDNSIQRAYIHQIRRSKKFMYIENQYFMGSSHEWFECRDARVANLIPLEIAAHIVEKIMNDERYVAYILIPMFPEGKPTDNVIQEMLHWQFRTIEMMYSKIAKAISSKGIDAHPQDFLLFFCLGKKEGRNPNPVPEELTGHAAQAFKHKRLMIYVHSKMAIFDDEYIIVGSANINDRSLNGNRDTEIAIGAFQTEYTASGDTVPHGEVSLFRKSLWVEHMGKMAPIDEDPSSIHCVKRVQELAEEGFNSFIDQEDAPGVRHLLIYPLEVQRNGSLSARSDCPTFPDTSASIIGKRSTFLPSSLTS